MSIFDYVDKYGDYSFKEKEFNEIDNVILSLLSYIDLNGIVDRDKVKILDVGNKYFNFHYNKEYNIMGVRNAIDVFKVIYNKKRYQNLDMYNYSYIGDNNSQFSAVCIDLDDNTTYISFEGTDHLISGWEEDFKMSYIFPVECQKNAIRYVNKYFTFSKKKLILGGHSKGGNLALVTGMYSNYFVRKRIINIYSNDGPGLRDKEIISKRYRNIENKLIKIIPNYSIVGLLLRHSDNYKVISSNKKSILAHATVYWEVNDDKFKEEELSDFSKVIDEAMVKWLDKYNDSEKERFVKSLFDIFRECCVNTITEIMNNKKKIIDIISKSRYLDNDNKKMVLDLFSVIFNYYKDYEIDKIKNKL